MGTYLLSLVNTHLMSAVEKTLSSGESILIAGPHGSGKSLAVYSVAYRIAAKGGLVIDLSADTPTFAEFLKIAEGAQHVFALFDAIPPQFYIEPEVWSEHAAFWRDNCGKVMARASYVRKRGHPVALVIPPELAVLCKSELKHYTRLDLTPEKEVAIQIFLENSDVYCGADYAREVVERIWEWGEGHYRIAFLAAKLLQYCDENPAEIAEKAKEKFVEEMAVYGKAVYAPTCSKARRFLRAIEARSLPLVLAAQAARWDAVETKIKILERLLAIADKLSGAHREYVKILALQTAEELKQAMRPSWLVKSLKVEAPLFEQALIKVAREVATNCGIEPKKPSVRALVKAYVMAQEAAYDLAEATLNLATGRNPCLGKLKALCINKEMQEPIVEAILAPYRLSIEIPPAGAKGIIRLVGIKAEEADEKNWLELLNFLYEAAERGEVDLRPFGDYVELALSRGSSITKRLALALVQLARRAPPDVVAQALITAVELGEQPAELLHKYITEVKDAAPLYQSGERCGDVVVEVATALASRLATENACDALKQLEVALMCAGYVDVINRYKPSSRCR